MNHPRTVEEVINDFKGRRAGIIKALTKNVEDFYEQCDPNSPSLCLHGYPDGPHWEVSPPYPSDLPVPRLGINFMRSDMGREEWLSMVALHSDAWLHAVASFFAIKLFDDANKRRLLKRIADIPPRYKVIKGEVARKRARSKSIDLDLPENVLNEVLLRLSVRDLLRYRSVCKMWCNLIDDHGFVLAQLKNSKINVEGNHLLVMELPRGWLKKGEVWVCGSDAFNEVMRLDCLDGVRDSWHLSYINGVMLVRKGVYSRKLFEIVLWNPSINRSLALPDFKFQAMRDASHCELGLGFDESLNDYKVIAIVYPRAELKDYFPDGTARHRAIEPGFVQVYTLSANSWRSLTNITAPPYWTRGRQAFVNGAIHWINLGPNIRDDSWHMMRDSYILSFDVANEVFNYFELPYGLNDHCQSINGEFMERSSLWGTKFMNLITVLEGSLAIFDL